MGQSEDNDARAAEEREKNRATELERIMGTLDTLLKRVDHQTTRIGDQGISLSETARGLEKVRAELKELSALWQKTVDTRDKHIEDLNAAIQVIGKVAQAGTFMTAYSTRYEGPQT